MHDEVGVELPLDETKTMQRDGWRTPACNFPYEWWMYDAEQDTHSYILPEEVAVCKEEHTQEGPCDGKQVSFSLM